MTGEKETWPVKRNNTIKTTSPPCLNIYGPPFNS